MDILRELLNKIQLDHRLNAKKKKIVDSHFWICCKLKETYCSYSSWGSQGKNTEVVCNSLLQWTTVCQTSPPWPVRLGWPHTAWLSFIELDKAVVHVIRLANCLWLWFQSVCPLMPSLNAYCLTCDMCKCTESVHVTLKHILGKSVVQETNLVWYKINSFTGHV